MPYSSENAHKDLILEYHKKHPEYSNTKLARVIIEEEDLELSVDSFRRAVGGVLHNLVPSDNNDVVLNNKKNQNLHWIEVCDWMIDGQKIHNKASFSQDFAKVSLPDVEDSILLLNLSDLHIGARGSDYGLLKNIIKEIIETPRLYVALTGDLLETAIRLRGVKEVAGQIIEPEMQINFLESLLEDIKHKVLWATWDNHTVQREEDQVGYSVYKRIIGRDKAIIYHNGLGHVDLTIGDETYNIVSTHKFIGRSLLNPIHGQMRYMRFEGQDREIAISGDSHKPAHGIYWDGNKKRAALNGGTLHTNSGYAKRYFSLFTVPEYPCIELFANKHDFIVYTNVGQWKEKQK